ncbi:retrovirus-related pol polyprotein from transposon TNT 1-94 [Tanacetum coccineum]
MNSSTIACKIHPINSNRLRRLFQFQKKAIERLKQGESINVQDLETNLYWELGKFTSQDGESLELSQPTATRNRGKAIVNSPPPTYDQEPTIVAEDDEMSNEKEIDKLMALISLLFKKIYKPTNNNLRTSSNTSRGHQDNTSKINRGTGYDNQRVVNVAADRENVAYHKEKILLCKQEEAGFQLNIQEITPDAADNYGRIFNSMPLQKVQNDDDNYNVFANDREHPKQPEFVNDTHLEEQGDTNITIDSLDISTNGETIDQDDNDLARERELLASLIEKLKCCYNDNLALMLAPESDEMIRLTQESRSKLNKNDKYFKENQSKVFLKEREQYFEIQDLKAKLQDKGIAISELKKLIEKMKGKYVETKIEKPSVIRQPNAFKSQRQSVLGKPATFSNSLAKTDFSKSKSVTTNNVSNDFSKPITTQILPQNTKSILKNTNVIVPGMYKVHTTPNQTRTPQFPQDIRETNKHVAFSKGVISTTSVSRPQLKSNRLEDRVMHNNSEGNKQQVEDHRMNFKFSNNKTSVTPCNDSLNAKTLNVNCVYVTCGKCVLNDNHDMCVLHYINGVNSRTKMPMDVPISTKEPKRTMNQSVATLLKRTVASESTNQKPRSKIRKQYEHLVGYVNGGTLRSHHRDIHGNLRLLVEIILFIIDSGCSKHMTGNLKLLSNFVEKFIGQTKVFSHMDLCGPIWVESINGKKYVLVIVDDYSRYTWTHFLWSKDKTPEVLIDFLRIFQRGLHAQVRKVRTDKGMEFFNNTLYAYFAQERIEHKTSIARTPEQNNVVERWNRNLVEAARTMISAAKVPLDGENLNKMKEKASNHVSSDPAPQCLTSALEHYSLSPGPQCQENITHTTETVTTSNELDLLFCLMFDELLNGTTPVVSKYFAVNAVDAPNKCQQQNTTSSTSTTIVADTLPLIIQTTPETTSQAPTQAPTITTTENTNQAKTNK